MNDKKPMTGTWTLTAPDGRSWQAQSPLACCGMESRERVPAEVALARILKAAEPTPDERDAERDIALLRSALVGLIGADGKQELRQMEATIRLFPAPAEDKAVSINAIHALLATFPFNAELPGAVGIRAE